MDNKINQKILRIIQSYESIIDWKYDTEEAMHLVADLDELFRKEAD